MNLQELNEQAETLDVTYSGIGENKELPRLWIEGAKLSLAGFTKGMRYTYQKVNNSLVLEPDEHGKGRVSGRNRHGRTLPIIDLKIPLLDEWFGRGARIKVVFSVNKITITLHHEEQAKRQREAQCIANLKKGTLKEASICTGGGISTTAVHDGLAEAGIKGDLCWVVDSNLSYLQSAAKNSWAINDTTSFYVGKVEEVESQYFTNVDLLSFSLPCTGLSKAGRSKHKLKPEEHESATSLFGLVNAIRNSNAAILVSENVHEAMGSSIYTLLIQELNRLGYKVLERILDSSDTGTIENRPRYWFLAVSEGLADGLFFDVGHVVKQSKLVSDILEKDIPESNWSTHEYLNDKARRDAEQGKGFKRQLLSGNETKVGVILRDYAKRRSTEPFLVREDGKERLFTPIEHSRLKSVPESLINGVCMTVAHQILGQSIDYLQGKLPIKSLVEQLMANLGLKPCMSEGLGLDRVAI